MGLVLRRLLIALPLILGVAVTTFVLGRLAPGDPISSLLENGVDPKVVEAVKERYGLNRPLIEQLWLYLLSLGRGDLGYSYSQGGIAVTEIIGEGWLVSLQLGALGVIVMVVVGIPMGIFAATHHNQWQDWLVRSFAIIGTSVPSFVLAYAALWTVGVQLRWLPIGGWGTIQQTILPALFLGLPGAAYLSRQTRAAMLDVISQDYIRTAQAKGLRWQKILYRHALRNALLPVFTVISPVLGAMVGGFFFIENIFSIPGIGKLSLQAVFSRDYPLLQALVLILAVGFILTNLLADIAYTWIDPRIRYKPI